MTPKQGNRDSLFVRFVRTMVNGFKGVSVTLEKDRQTDQAKPRFWAKWGWRI